MRRVFMGTMQSGKSLQTTVIQTKWRVYSTMVRSFHNHREIVGESLSGYKKPILGGETSLRLCESTKEPMENLRELLGRLSLRLERLKSCVCEIKIGKFRSE